MSKAKISIIIPVYNVEKYLETCLESVINQTMSELEIICVNDGSTDRSPEILEEFAKNDERIKIINKENGGIASARNKALDHVKGDYIGFVDSDDWIEPHMYETLYKNAEKNDSDMVMCSAHRFDEITRELLYDMPYFTLECFDETFNDTVFNHQTTGNFLFKISVTAWNKIYKTSFLKENDIKFPEGLDFEDNAFFYESYLKANKVSLVRDHLYFYRINRRGSFISSGNKRFFDIVPMMNLIENILKTTGNNEYLEEFFSFKFLDFIGRVNQVDDEYQQQFFEIIKEDISKMDPNDILLLNETNRAKYENFMNSHTYKEYKLLEKIHHLENSLEKKINKQRREYEDKLNKQIISFNKEIEIRDKIIEKMRSSNSWKITKPLRNVRILFKKE